MKRRTNDEACGCYACSRINHLNTEKTGVNIRFALLLYRFDDQYQVYSEDIQLQPRKAEAHQPASEFCRLVYKTEAYYKQMWVF